MAPLLTPDVRAMLEALRNPVLVTDAQLDAPGPHIVYANAALTHLTGYTCEELVGKTPRIFQGPRSNRRELDRMKGLLAAAHTFVGETINYAKDGTELVWEVTITPLEDKGVVTGYVSVGHFRGDRQALLEAVRRANAEWVSILDALDDIIILEGKDGRIIRCNRAAAHHFGEDVRGATGVLLSERLWRTGSEPTSGTNARVRLRGCDDWFEHSGYALADGSGHVHVLTNINERKQLEAVAEGINISDNLNFMVSGIRHELGNPLNSVKMALSVLSERLPKLRLGDIEMYLGRMNEQVTRMEYLLHLLRSFAASEVQSPRPLDLQKHIEDFLSLSRTDFESKGCTLVLQAANVPLILGEPRAIQQVLLNLVANAVDAKRPTDPLTVYLKVGLQGDRVVLSVIDDGLGMTEAQQATLFRPFVTGKTHGTGLGLSIVRRLLSPLGATISILSAPNVGTTVEIGFVVVDKVP